MNDRLAISPRLDEPWDGCEEQVGAVPTADLIAALTRRVRPPFGPSDETRERYKAATAAAAEELNERIPAREWKR